MRVVFMGTPEFAVAPLEYLVTDGYEVVATYTQPDKAAGRGRSVVDTPVKKLAVVLHLPVVQPVSLRAAGAVEELAGFKPDVMVVAAYGQILPQAVLDIPRFGCLNIHPSLLPKFRGVSPVAAAILAGDEFAGVSVMLLDRGTDTGPVLARAQISVSTRDTTGSLSGKLSRIGAQLLLDVLPRWERGELESHPQDEAQASYSRKLTKEDGEIDWRLPAVDIWRRVRAFDPWPGCYTTWHGKHLKMIEAKPLSVKDTWKVGQVIAAPAAGVPIGVGTGDGVLGVLAVQLEGKRAMPAAEFLRGQREFVGTVLPG
jgi:methionyl-tRNA formyltransferase